jgi:hypothetical protein
VYLVLSDLGHSASGFRLSAFSFRLSGLTKVFEHAKKMPSEATGLKTPAIPSTTKAESQKPKANGVTQRRPAPQPAV